MGSFITSHTDNTTMGSTICITTGESQAYTAKSVGFMIDLISLACGAGKEEDTLT